MKLSWSALVVAILLISRASFAKAPDPSSFVPLIEAMKNEYHFSDIEIQSKNYKTYFLSERFTQDATSGKWDGGIEVIADEVPLSMSGSASADDRHSFQEKIRTHTIVSLNAATLSKIGQRILNPEVMKAFAEMVKAYMLELGFISTVDEDGSFVVFNVAFRTDTPGTVPIIRALHVDGGSILGKEERVGKPMTAPIVVRARRDGNVVVFFSLETSLGSVILQSNGKGMFLSGIPVGTVIFSMLPPNRFAEATDDKSAFKPDDAAWVPADGRNVAGSKYARIISSLVPDMRGMFARGVNQMEPGNLRRDGNQDSRDRAAGDYQKDTNAAHTHTVGLNGGDSFQMVGNPAINAQRLAQFNGDGYGAGPAKITGSSGDAESQPKNIAGYWYVKIN